MNKDLIEVWVTMVFACLLIRSVESIPSQLRLHFVWGMENLLVRSGGYPLD